MSQTALWTFHTLFVKTQDTLQLLHTPQHNETGTNQVTRRKPAALRAAAASRALCLVSVYSVASSSGGPGNRHGVKVCVLF